ncbi:MAG: phage tail protein [Gammaproteobacteria bacterium]
MAVDFSIELDASEVERFFQNAPRKIFNARRSAIRTTTTFADKELKTRMAAATGLPATVFRVYRTFKRASDDRGSVWLGVKPVKAAHAGKLEQRDFGASAGKYYFEGGFVAHMKSGHSSIFKRKGKQRLPIVEQVVELPQARVVAGDVFQATQEELQRRYLEKLEAELRKR